MRKFLTKLSAFFLPVIALVISVTIIFNAILLASRNKIAASANKYLGDGISCDVTTGSAVYLPPAFIILENVSFQQKSGLALKSLITIPMTVIRLSLLKSIFKRRLFVSGIYIYKPRAGHSELYSFVRDNFSQILEFIRRLPRQDIDFSIGEASLSIDKNGYRPVCITTSFILKIRDAAISGFASVRKSKIPFYTKSKVRRKDLSKDPTSHCSFRGALTNDGISLEKIEFFSESLYSQLWGSFQGNIFSLKGFTFISTPSKIRDNKKPLFDIIGEVRFIPQKNKAPSVAIELPLRPDLYVLDIDFLAELAFPRIQISHLNFSLNNIPFSVKGNVFFRDSLALDLSFSAYLEHLEQNQMAHLKKIDLKVLGNLREKIFIGDIALGLDFVKKKKDDLPAERFEARFGESAIYFDKYPRLTMHFVDGNLFCQTSSNKYRISLKDVTAFCSLKDKRLKFIKFNSLFYDGHLEGQGRIDVAYLPPRIVSSIRIKNASAQKLDELLVHFSKVYGNMASKMYFSNYPYLNLNGSMIIKGGYLNNLEFLRWLADFFGLPVLKRVYFSKAVSNFSVNPEGASLHEIDLDSKDVNLGGYFTLGADDLVASVISLGLDRKLLKSSRKFKPLLNLLHKDFAPLGFNFQLSGVLHRMNFHWLSSDLKKELQRSIPNFIESKIDAAVERIIETQP